MTKLDLANRIADSLGIDPGRALRIIEAISKTIIDAVAQGSVVRLENFGTFSVRVKHDRRGGGSDSEDSTSSIRIPDFTAGDTTADHASHSDERVLTDDDIVSAVTDLLRYDRELIAKALTVYRAIISDTVIEPGSRVEISGFGTYSADRSIEQNAVDALTGEEKVVAGTTVLTLRPAAEFKDKLDG